MKIKAAVLYEPHKPMVVETIDIDEPREGEVLVRIAAAGVCYSDYHIMIGEWSWPLPVVLGHEGAGVVERVGPGVTRMEPGQTVILNFRANCGTCHYCIIGRPVLCDGVSAPRHTLFDGSSRLSKDGQTIHHMARTSCFAEYAVVPESGAVPVRDEDYLTRRFGELCVDFAHRGLPEEVNEEHRMAVAGRALNYLNENKQFDLVDFERTLDDPELIEQFTLFRENYQEETGSALEDRFTLSVPEARKAKKRLTGKLKLDTGAEVRFSSAFIDQAENLLERGYDEQKEMHYLKIYFDNQLQ